MALSESSEGSDVDYKRGRGQKWTRNRLEAQLPWDPVSVCTKGGGSSVRTLTADLKAISKACSGPSEACNGEGQKWWGRATGTALPHCGGKSSCAVCLTACSYPCPDAP